MSLCVQRVFSNTTLLHMCSLEGALTLKLWIDVSMYICANEHVFTLFVEVPNRNNQIRQE